MDTEKQNAQGDLAPALSGASTDTTDALDACQQRLVTALEKAAHTFKAETQGEALHYILGAILAEHNDIPAVRGAIDAIREREHAARLARA